MKKGKEEKVHKPSGWMTATLCAGDDIDSAGMVLLSLHSGVTVIESWCRYFIARLSFNK